MNNKKTTFWNDLSKRFRSTIYTRKVRRLVRMDKLKRLKKNWN